MTPEQRSDQRALERAGMDPSLAEQIIALPVAENLDGSWALRCPWCHGMVTAWFLHDASDVLARHAYASHLWELLVLENHLAAWRRQEAQRVDRLAA